MEYCAVRHVNVSVYTVKRTIFLECTVSTVVGEKREDPEKTKYRSGKNK